MVFSCQKAISGFRKKALTVLSSRMVRLVFCKLRNFLLGTHCRVESSGEWLSNRDS